MPTERGRLRMSYDRLERSPSERSVSSRSASSPSRYEIPIAEADYTASQRMSPNSSVVEAPYNVDQIVHSLIAGMEEDVPKHTGPEDDTDSLFPHHDHAQSKLKDDQEKKFLSNSGTFVRKLGVWADGDEDVSKRAAAVPMMKVSSLRCRRFCKYVPCLLLLVLVVTCSLILIKQARTEKASIPPVSSFAGSHELVLLPDEDLSRKCSQQFYEELSNGLGPCQTACAAGACCHDEDLHKNCYANNPESCSLYSVCLVLKDSRTGTFSRPKLAPPPQDIEIFCDPSEIENSIDVCESLCRPSKCCFSSDNSNACYSYSDNDIKCDDYRVWCSILGAAYGGIGTGPPKGGTIDSKNTTDTSGQNTIDGSGQDTTDTNALGEILSDAPTELEYWCSGQDDDSCKKFCDYAICCVEMTGADNCKLETCVTYMYCVKVNPDFEKLPGQVAQQYGSSLGEDGVVPYPSEELAIECQRADGDYPSLSLICTAMCLPVSDCCVNEDPSANCYEQNKQACDMYAPCFAIDERYEKLVGLSSSLSSNQSDLGGSSNSSTTLSDSPLELEYWCNGQDTDSCSAACEQAKCCLDVEMQRCQIPLETCITYIYCAEIIPEFADLEGQVAGTFSTQPPTDGIMPDPSPDLATICAKADGNYPSLSIVCENLCLPVSDCCVNENPVKNCFSTNVETCLLYKPCEAVDPRYENLVAIRVGDDSDSSSALTEPPTDIARTCNFLYFAEDPESEDQCRLICESAKCCTSDDTTSSCVQTDVATCLQYMPCVSVDQGFLKLASTPYGELYAPSADDIQKVCSAEQINSSGGVDGECQHLCDNAACCVHPVAEANCLDQYQSVCQMYAPCAIVFPEFGQLDSRAAADTLPSSVTEEGDTTDPPDTSGPPPPPDQLSFLCSRATLGVSSSPCESECMAAKCCFTDLTGVQQCENTEQCNKYQICNNLWD